MKDSPHTEIVSVFGYKFAKPSTGMEVSVEEYTADCVLVKIKHPDETLWSLPVSTQTYGGSNENFIREFNKLVLGRDE